MKLTSQFKLNHYLPIWLLSGLMIGIILALIPNKTVLLISIIITILYCLYFTNRFYTRIIAIGLVIGIVRMSAEIWAINFTYSQIIYGRNIIFGKIINKTNSGYLIRVKTSGNIDLDYLNSYYVNLITDKELPMFKDMIADAHLYQFSQSNIPIESPRELKAFFSRVIGNALLENHQILQSEVPRVRNRLLDKINMAFNKTNRDFICAILFGLNELDKKITDKFRRIGISHLLAISGLHFSLFATIFYFIGRWLVAIPFVRFVPMQYIGIIMSMFGLIYYFSITNISWSVIRSLLMSLAPVITLFVGRAIKSKDLVILVMLIILAISPQALLDPGFQLSFIAVLTLLARKSNLLVSTVLVLLTTAPYSLYYFGYTNLQPFFASIVCIPYFSFIIMPLVAVGAILYFPYPIVFLTNIALRYFLYIIDYLNNFIIIENYARISTFGIIVFTIGLIVFLLINNIYIMLIFCMTGIMAQKSHKDLICISNDGHNIVYITKHIIYTNNFDSFYTQYIKSYFIDKIIIEFPESFKPTNKIYKIKNIMLRLTNEGRFVNAIRDGQIILTRWEISRNKNPGFIKL